MINSVPSVIMIATPLKLKIKFPTRGPEPCEFRRQLSAPKAGGDSSSDNSVSRVDALKSKTSLASTVGTKRHLVGGDSSENGTKKRKPEEMLDSQQGKRQKMDRAMTFHCVTLLRKLMSNPWSSIFNKPVDPVALNIPDYFSVITNPMDLGTVKSKLDKNAYSSIEDFAADIRLTVSNAMFYNPPDNFVHKYAKELGDQFEARWKALEGKFKIGKSEVEDITPIRQMKRDNDLRQNCPTTPLLHENTLPNKSNISGEKTKNVECNAKPATAKLSRPVQNSTSNSLGKMLSKGFNISRGCARVSTKPAMDSRASKCSTCGNLRCQCNLNNDSSRTSSSDVTLERSISGDHNLSTTDASKVDGLAKSTLTSQMKKSDPDSDGVLSAFDDWMACQSSQPKSPPVEAVVSEGKTTSIPDVQLSPSKALRAAILKSRFAETIFKAKRKTLLIHHVDKVDSSKAQQERERLEKMQQQEKAKIEAEVRAAEAAARIKAEAELKERREKEREAARIALQQVEKSVELEQNLEILRELETLCGCCLSTYCLFHTDRSHQPVVGAFKRPYIGNPLQELGLFIKDEHLDEEEEEEETTFVDYVEEEEEEEEGEIL